MNKFDSSDSVELDIIPNNYQNFDEIDITENDLPKKGFALLVGTIYCANYLPNINKDDNNTDCFYKVLFAEESNKFSNKLRCKTTIFTSKKASYSNNPIWSTNTPEIFKLETDLFSTNKIYIPGDIIIVIYRTKSNGGNEIIGECNINIDSIVNTGETQFYIPQTEGRSLVGTYPLSSQISNNMTISLRLQVVWRKVIIENDIKVLPNAEVIPIMKSSDSRPNSTSSSRSGSATPSSVNKSHRSLTSSNVKVGSTNGVRKIASASVRKSMNDQRRIDRENKIMSSKLAALSTNKSSSNKKPYSDPVVIPKRSNDITTTNIENDDELYSQLEDLKVQLKDQTNENNLLKGQLNKLVTQNKKQEIAIEKINKLTTNLSLNNTTTSSIDDFKAITSRESVLSKYDLVEDQIIDKELLDIVDEHIILQTLRYDLINRINSSKSNIQLNNNKLLNQLNDFQILQKKYSVVCPNVFTDIQFADSKIDRSIESSNKDTNKEIESFKRYLNILKEYTIIKELYSEGYTIDNSNINDIDGSYLEIETINSCIEERKSQLQSEVSSLQYELDTYNERLSLFNEKSFDAMRTNIQYIKNVELKLINEKRVQDLLNMKIS